MNLTDLLKGKKVNYLTDAKIKVELEILEVKVENHSQQLEESTAQNDWWPASREWTTYKVRFTNGFTKSYDSLEEIDLIQ